MKTKEIYIKKVLGQIPRLLGQLDRNKFSPTYGSFCFEYWHDKILDFPSGHVQESTLTLALLFKFDFNGNIYYKNEKIKKWCIASMLYWSKIQHKDGSFDEFYKNERQLGSTAISLWAILESFKILENEIDVSKKDIILKSIRKAVFWILKNDESTNLCNHQAQCLLALHHAKRYLKSDSEKIDIGIKYRINRIEKMFHEEGWFEEYDGPDMGYLTTCISFLAKYYKETNDESILKKLKKSVKFISFFACPDYSFGGIIGNRNTAHFWPHGFEILNNHIDLAGSINDYIIFGLKNNSIISPNMLDRYFNEQLYDFILAYLDYSERKRKIELPFERDDFMVYFDDAKIVVHKKDNIYIIISAYKGGITHVFDCINGKLILSDCGITCKLNNKIITSQWFDKTYKINMNLKENFIEIDGMFHEVKPQYLDTKKMLIFKLYMSTFGNIKFMSKIMKTFLIKNLINRDKKVKISFKRKINLSDILIEDWIKNYKREKFENITFGNDYQWIYTGYSKYFNINQINIKESSLNENEIKILNKENHIYIKRKILK